MDYREYNWVFIGLSITSSWGNGHATTYRALIRSLSKKGHRVLFLERDETWYADNRDMPEPDFCDVELYRDFHDLKRRFGVVVSQADVVIIGSYTRGGVEIGDWVLRTAQGIKAFYDIDTPVTLSKITHNDFEYIHPRQISRYDIYLSFSGGKALQILESQYRSPAARPLYCSVDSHLYFPEPQDLEWDLGYLGTYSADRQPSLDKFLLAPAQLSQRGRFVVAGPQYPSDTKWPSNVCRIEHLPPCDHQRFYNTQRFTLNITRNDMKRIGHSPSVRLFEAAACGVPIISDYWPGLDDFFRISDEILTCESTSDVLEILRDFPESERRAIAKRARAKVLKNHTSERRAEQLEQYVREASIPASEQQDIREMPITSAM